jgi:PIN domain nuclease of toxin-antitoxin system
VPVVSNLCEAKTNLSQLVDQAASFEHAAAAGGVPVHHGDPFDRMLVARARLESCTLVTHDRLIAAYDVATLWT